ncbi:hypothetical protein HY642_02045 [Candidatus Woesearchaeota archaeon]|nr:hypothetical protein [Candidatus Woesearchaeota archaeon]
MWHPEIPFVFLSGSTKQYASMRAVADKFSVPPGICHRYDSGSSKYETDCHIHLPEAAWRAASIAKADGSDPVVYAVSTRLASGRSVPGSGLFDCIDATLESDAPLHPSFLINVGKLIWAGEEEKVRALYKGPRVSMPMLIALLYGDRPPSFSKRD